MDQEVIIFVGATFLSVTLLLIALRDVGRQRSLVTERMQRYESAMAGSVSGYSALSGESVLRDRRLSSFSLLDRLLRMGSSGEGMALDLARANISLRVGEYVLLRLVTALISAFILQTLGQSQLLSIVGAIVGFYLPKMYVNRVEAARVRKFNDQLMDAIGMISNSLKAGFSVVQGLELVSREMPAPMSEEMVQVLGEMGLGSSFEDAMASLTRRIRSYDLDLTVTAMLIQTEVGGNLSEILDNISHTIRQRIQLKNEIHALTSEVRLSAYILAFLPPIMAIVLFMINQQYIMDLITEPSGQLMLVAGTILEIIGIIVLFRLADIEV